MFALLEENSVFIGGLTTSPDNMFLGGVQGDSLAGQRGQLIMKGENSVFSY